jgi:uncharacterized membrane protein HdeD (DUF308 family)
MAAPQAIPLSAVAPTTAEGVDAPWWVTLIAGIGMTFMGVLLILAPGISLVVTAQVVGLYWFLDGIVRLVSIFVDRSDWGWKLLIGVLGVLAGLAILQHPLWSAGLFPAMAALYIGIVGVFIGVGELTLALLRGAGWGTGLLGVVSVILGLLLMFNPLAGAAALPFLCGGIGIVAGIVTAVMSFKLR